MLFRSSTEASGTFQTVVGTNNVRNNSSSIFVVGTGDWSTTFSRDSFKVEAFDFTNPTNGGHIVMPHVSQSLNFINDASAAAAGVPLGGIYHNNGILRIRLV